MTERPSHNLRGLPVDLARSIDVVCHRFENDRRQGRRPPIDEYLADVPDEGRLALRAELEALERELRPRDASAAHSELVAATNPELGAETGAPSLETTTPGTVSGIGDTRASVHDQPTLATVDPPRAPYDQPTAPALGQATSGTADSGGLARVRYFGDYEIIQEIARGGMGVVFRARQTTLNRTVALKMILAGQLADDVEVKRFYTEAEAAAHLDHPGIVPIFEVGRHEGQHYFSMGFVEGRSLAQRLADGPLPARQAAGLIHRVSEAVEYAHKCGVIHRDLKPANILLDRDGNPRITDFGLAKKVGGDSALTGSGQIMGTPSYMPPEQAGGNRGDVGPTADVYALGATLYALLVGRPPFQAATPMDTVIQVLGDEPAPPRRLNASIPRDLETICLKCLEKQPARRYASASALAADLRRFLAGEPIVARPVTTAERAVKWVRRSPVVASLLALVAVVSALGLGGVLWQWRAAVLARRFAERESDRAIAQTKLADQRLQDSLAAQANERKQTRLAEQRLYDVQMNAVQPLWEDYQRDLFQQALDEQLPANQGGVDRRGFEWFYWQRKIASGHITFTRHAGLVVAAAFMPRRQAHRIRKPLI